MSQNTTAQASIQPELPKVVLPGFRCAQEVSPGCADAPAAGARAEVPRNGLGARTSRAA